MSDATDEALLEDQRAKLTAETAAALASARRDEALAIKYKSEARKAAAEAAEAETSALVEAIRHRALAREEANELAADTNHHTYRFTGPVTAQSVGACVSRLTQWHRQDPDTGLTVVFNSPGGSVIDGMELWDFLNQLRMEGHHLTTVCRGYAASMAGILLQAGTERVIGRESYLMIHEISAGTGGKIGEIKDDVKFYEHICERIVDIFVDRSGGKCTKARFVKSWTRQDWWLDSDEALKLGFVDRIA